MVSKVIPSDFKLPIGIAALGLAITGTGNVGAGFPVSLVGLALAFQATRVSFEFDDVVGCGCLWRLECGCVRWW